MHLHSTLYLYFTIYIPYYLVLSVDQVGTRNWILMRPESAEKCLNNVSFFINFLINLWHIFNDFSKFRSAYGALHIEK